MGERTSYQPGTFSWVELATSDAGAANAFYGEIFGWTYDDRSMGDAGVYSMCRRDGRYVGALFDSTRFPTAWGCYVSVESVDASAAAARELGATLHGEPFDVFDAGRMVSIADPAGASLSLWEAREHIGATLVNAPGALSWNDLLTPDVGAAASFYERLLGWTTSEVPDGMGYRVISNRGRSNGGMMPISAGDVAPAWLPYFGHEDVDRLQREIGALGGRALGEVRQMPQGRIATFADPQGAVFAVWTGGYDD